MALSNKLCNPTPFDAEINYSQGVVVVIPSDGHTILTKGQMDDFDETQPGYEETRQILETKGLFLEDPNREYDAQAVEAIRNAIKIKKDRINDCITTLRGLLLKENMDANPESDIFQERLKQMGITGLERQVDILEKRVNAFKKALGPDFDSAITATAPRLDPERTCFVMDPPREFASVTALNIFLEENPEIRQQHESFMNAQESSDEQPSF